MSWSSSAQIGEIIQNALLFNVQNWQNWHGESMTADSLIKSVQDFFDLLEQRKIKYVLAGGIALLYYVEGRNTQDLDILMAGPSLAKLPELEIANRGVYFVHTEFRGLPIDILLTRNPLFKKVHTKYSRVVHLLDRNVPIATVEGLLLLKFYALPSLYRQGNFARIGIHENDIATLIHYYKPDMQKLLNELAKYVDESNLIELQRIASEAQNRASRFGDKIRD